MIRSTHGTALLLLCLSCRSLSSTVQQNPPSIFGTSLVPAEINCSHTISSYYVILWYQQPVGDSSLKLIGYVSYTNPTIEDTFKSQFDVTGDGSSKSKLQVLNVTSGAYFCAASIGGFSGTEAYFGKGTKVSVLEPEINITKPIVEVLRPSPKECGKVKASGKSKASEKTIVCVASGFYPDHVGVEWTISGGDHNVTGRVATDPAARRRDKSYHITSRLTVSAKEFTEKTMFTCNVSFFNGMDTVYVSNFIHGDSAGGGIMTRDKYLMVTQTAKFSYGFLIIKSSIFGALLALLVWKLQRSGGKQHD